MDKFSPVVITSKAASQDLNKIKGEHADIIQGIQDQSVKVANYNAEQAARKAAQFQTDQASKQNNDKLQADAEAKRLEAQNKSRELDIKQQALSL